MNLLYADFGQRYKARRFVFQSETMSDRTQSAETNTESVPQSYENPEQVAQNQEALENALENSQEAKLLDNELAQALNEAEGKKVEVNRVFETVEDYKKYVEAVNPYISDDAAFEEFKQNFKIDMEAKTVYLNKPYVFERTFRDARHELYKRYLDRALAESGNSQLSNEEMREVLSSPEHKARIIRWETHYLERTLEGCKNAVKKQVLENQLKQVQDPSYDPFNSYVDNLYFREAGLYVVSMLRPETLEKANTAGKDEYGSGNEHVDYENQAYGPRQQAVDIWKKPTKTMNWSAEDKARFDAAKYGNIKKS